MEVSKHGALALLACATVAVSGCAAEDPTTSTRPTPTSTEGQWNAGLEVSSFNTSGKATFTYADGTTRTVRFSGHEDQITDTSLVLVGQSVSIAVSVEQSTRGRASQANCLIFEADFELLGEGKIPMVTKTGRKGDAFTCRWTNDGTLPTPKPEK
jgi:hypothetical protein